MVNIELYLAHDGLIIIWEIEVLEMKYSKGPKEEKLPLLQFHGPDAVKVVELNRAMLDKIPQSELKELYKIYIDDMFPKKKQVDQDQDPPVAKKHERRSNFVYTPNIKQVINTPSLLEITKNYELYVISYSIDQHVIFSGGVDCNVNIWNVENGNHLGTLKVFICQNNT